MKMKTLSLSRTISTGIIALKNSTKRFPISIVFTFAFTIYSLWLIWGKKNGFTEQQTTTVIYYLTIGSLLSITLQLWGEEVKRKWIVIVINLLAHIALIADALYLYRLPENKFTIEIDLAHGAMITALGIAVLFVSFFREKNDVPAWNFTLQIAERTTTSIIVGLILWVGTAILLGALHALFQVKINDRCFTTLPLLCCQLLPTLLFLGLIPAKERKHDLTIVSSGFLNKVIRYLILPLLGSYLLVLYAYAAKILVEWQLPDGWVSKLVTALMAGCIGVEIMFYPSLRKKGERFNHFIAHWLPLIILPMLLLMTIGIFRRINDYGITLNRLYLLTLNGWYYLVCIGLFLTKAKRIHWIAISFGGLFLITSAFPVNYASITRKYMVNHVTKVLNDTYHGTLPMSEEQYFDWISTLPQEEALLVNSRLRYLDITFNDSITNRLFQQDSIAGKLVSQIPSYYTTESHIRNLHSRMEKSRKETDKTVSEDKAPEKAVTKNYHINFRGKQAWKLPSTTEASIEVYAKDFVEFISSKDGFVSLLLPDEYQNDTAHIRLMDLSKWDNMMNPPLPQKFSCTPSGNLFILTAIDFSIETPYTGSEKGKAKISGYRLIEKRKSKQIKRTYKYGQTTTL